MPILKLFKRFLSGELAAEGAATRYRRAADEVAKLSVEDARKIAFEALNDPEVIEEFEPTGPIPHLPFSEMTTDFLAEHGHFECVWDGMMVDVNKAQRWPPHPEFIVIGITPDRESVLLVRENDDTVCETDGSERIEDMLRFGFPTIFHWLAYYQRVRET